MSGNNGNGAGNIEGAAGGDRWADRDKLILVIEASLVDGLSDIEVRRFFNTPLVEPVTVGQRQKMAKCRASIVYDSLVAVMIKAAKQVVSEPYTGYAWKNLAVVYLTNEHFSGLVWNGAKWITRLETTGLNFGGIMRAGMCSHKKLNLTACDSSGVPIVQHGPFVPFKTPALENGFYARTQYSRSLWTAERRAAVLGAGWFLPWEPGEFGGFDNFSTGPVNLMYGPIAGVGLDAVVSLPWPDNLLVVRMYQFQVNYQASNSIDDAGNEYKWAFGPFSHPPHLDLVRWLPFEEQMPARVFKYWFPGSFGSELNGES